MANIVFSVGLGSVVMTGLGNQLIAQQLPQHLEKITLNVSGVVTGIPKKVDEVGSSKTAFDFLPVSDIDNPLCGKPNHRLVKGLIRLSWSEKYAADSKPALKSIFTHLSPGQPFCFSVRLRRPRSLSNPGGFDYQRWLVSEGYTATGYVVDVIQTMDHSSPSVVDRIRWRVYSFYEQQASGSDLMGSFLALSIGEKFAVTDAQWQLLQSTGTVHLLVISGLHVGIVAALGLLIGYFIAKLVGWRTGVYPVWVAPLVSTLFVAGYVLLAGFSLPTQRAFVMVMVTNALLASGRLNRVWLGYWLSMVICLLIDPLAAHGSGFWLSFAVVAVILTGIARYDVNKPVVSFFYLQMRIFVGMALPLGFLTSGISVLGLVVNVVAIPYVSFVVVPLILGTTLIGLCWSNSSVAEGLVSVSGIAIHGFWKGLQASESIVSYVNDTFPTWRLNGFLQLPTLQISPWQWLFAFCSAGLLLVPFFSLWGRFLLTLSIGIVLFYSNGPRNFAQLIVFDVGQGLASVVQFASKTVIYDTGPPIGNDGSQAERVLAPYLLKSNVERIDQLIVSHGDSDHASGLRTLTDLFEIDSVLAGEQNRISITSDRCIRGQVWEWDIPDTTITVRSEVLWPVEPSSDLASNDKSCVVFIKIADLSVLFTGDISKSVEWELVRLGVPDIDVLIAPHHGSKSSSSIRFLLAVNPEHIVFSTGYLNRYRHPSKQVIARIQKYLPETQLWNTATDGAIQVVVDGDFDWQIYASRKINRRFWHSLE